MPSGMSLLLTKIVVARIAQFSSASFWDRIPTRQTWRGSHNSCTQSRLCCGRGILNLGNLNLLFGAVSLAYLCSKGRHPLLFLSYKQRLCSPFPDCLFKDVCTTTSLGRYDVSLQEKRWVCLRACVPSCFMCAHNTSVLFPGEKHHIF